MSSFLKSIISSLGWTHVFLVTDQVTNRATQLCHQLAKNGVYSALISVNKSLDHGYELMHEEIPFLVVEDKWDSVKSTLEAYGNYRKPPLSFGVLSETKDLEDLYRSVNISTSFYHIDLRSMVASYVQTFSNSLSTVINELKTNNQSGYFQENFDLQGTKLKASAMTYAPWLWVGPCNDFGQDCLTSGFLHDVMDTLAGWNNFTWSCDLPLDRSWGEFPPEEMTRWSLTALNTSTGSIRDVLLGGYDVMLSDWTLSHYRAQWVDFPLALTEVMYDAVIMLNKPSSDPYLLLRPFSGGAWIAILFCLLFCSLCLFPMSRLEMAKDSKRLLWLILGLFHVLVLTHHGGVMTSFYSTPPDLPFHSLKEGMERYPEYKMVVEKGQSQP